MHIGRIFEIKRFAVHDGPGIRTTVFFKGCPLSCVWCHNPEGISSISEIAFLERKCVACGECLLICPHGLHIINDKKQHMIDRDRCTLCLACIDACTPEAIKLYGKDFTVGDLFAIVSKDMDFYEQSGGGITCSGGEPLMQADFLAAFLSACRDAGMHTAVDTSGYANRKDLERVIPFTDLFLYDIKHMDPVMHKELTGVDNRLILDNLQVLSEQGAAVEIRIPVIPGYNDSEKNILQTATFLQGIKTLTFVRPLQYHALSDSKYSSIGKEHNMPAATDEEYAAAQHVCDILIDKGINCKRP